MNTSTSNLKDKVVKRAVNSLRKSKRIEQLSFVAIANELNVRVDEIQAFYTTTEDIFLEAQKKDWESRVFIFIFGTSFNLSSSIGT